MEIRIRTKDGKQYRSKGYIEGAFSIKLFYPEVWNYALGEWQRIDKTSFVIIPFTEIQMISGSGKAKEFKNG